LVIYSFDPSGATESFVWVDFFGHEVCVESMDHELDRSDPDYDPDLPMGSAEPSCEYTLASDALQYYDGRRDLVEVPRWVALECEPDAGDSMVLLGGRDGRRALECLALIEQCPQIAYTEEQERQIEHARWSALSPEEQRDEAEAKLLAEAAAKQARASELASRWLWLAGVEG
jgi:hypothetical protein